MVLSPAQRLKASVVAALQCKDGRGIQITDIIDLVWKYALSTECMYAACGVCVW